MRLLCQCGKDATRYAIVRVGSSHTVLYMCDECSETESQYGTEIHELYFGDDRYGSKQLSEVMRNMLGIQPMTAVGLSRELEKNQYVIRRILADSDTFAVIGANKDNVEVWGIAVH